ncbi:MAG: hypothetical protein DHS20C21_03360 [Gemmatimonadota bacterium]|nr:MAG: hypothetical protein DHS20C21_03360 [Gemmatimonadota bacterium]
MAENDRIEKYRTTHEKRALRIHEALHHDKYGGVLSHLYGCLDSLDSKATAAITLNGVVFVVASLLISNAGSPGAFWCFVATIAFSFVSCGLAVSVVKVHWARPEDLDRLEDYLPRLFQLRSSRTRAYRWALALAAGGMITLAAGAIIIGLATL